MMTRENEKEKRRDRKMKRKKGKILKKDGITALL